MDEQQSETPLALSSAVAEAVVDCAGHIAEAEMPLAAGLRISAAECDSWRLAAGLRCIARELERGRSLSECLQSATRRLPPHLSGLIAAAERGGAVGPMLAEWLENRRAAREQWRAIVAALAYPLLSVALSLGLFLFFATVVVRPFEQMYSEFGLKLPAVTVHFLRACRLAVPILVFLAAALVAIGVAARAFGGRAGWSWLLTSLPLIGRAWHWTGVSEMLRSLALLVEHRVPLAEALRLTAGAITDAYVAAQCRSLAACIERGESLTMSLVRLRTLPVSIVPLVRWGEKHNELAAGLRAAAEMIEGRLQVRAGLVMQVVPPFVFVAVGSGIAVGVIALYLPIISLIQGLS